MKTKIGWINKHDGYRRNFNFDNCYRTLFSDFYRRWCGNYVY